MSSDVVIKPKQNNINLQFSKISLNADYCKKCNVHQNDFVHLTNNGELVSNALYRTGGFGTPKLNIDNYFMLLKYIEAFYNDNITKDKKAKPHLEGTWCILDKYGNEKKEFTGIYYPYLIKNSVIYSYNNSYFNIETGECYGSSYKSIESNDYLFLENLYDKDIAKRGVLKINKKDGSYELFH